MLKNLPVEKLDEIHKAVHGALESEVEDGISYYMDALSDDSRRGTKMTEEDLRRMQPVLKVFEVLKAYAELQKAYQPAF